MLGDVVLNRLGNLLGVFVAAVLYFVAVYHLTNLYIARQHEVERFILLDGGVYTALFWVGQVLLGSLVAARAAVRPRLEPLALGHRAGGAVRDRRRPCAALRDHHRRAGLSPVDVPGQGCREQLLRRRGGRLRAQSARNGCSASGGVALAWRSLAVALKCCRSLPHSRGGPATTDPTAACSRLARFRRPQILGQDHRSIGLCAALRARGRGRAAVQERPGLHRSAVARARRRAALPQPRPLPEQRGGDPRRVRAAHVREPTLGIVEGNKGLYDGLALDGSNSNAALAAHARRCRWCW